MGDYKFVSLHDVLTIPSGLDDIDIMPEDTQYGFMTNSEGLDFFFAMHIPDVVVSGVNIEIGTSEHACKYAETFNRNAQKGRASFLMEPFGHGLSSRKFEDRSKMSGRDFFKQAHDSKDFLDSVVRSELEQRGMGHLEIHGLGASQGAQRKLHMHYAYPGIESSLILGSPMVDQIELSNFANHLIRRPNILARYMSMRFHAGDAEADVVKTKFETELEKHVTKFAETDPPAMWHTENPQLRAHRVTLDWIATSATACIRTKHEGFAENITTPTLFILAESWNGLRKRICDPCVDNSAAHGFEDRMSTSALVKFRGGHDLLKEKPDVRESVFELSDEFYTHPQECIDRINYVSTAVKGKPVTDQPDPAIPVPTEPEHSVLEPS